MIDRKQKAKQSQRQRRHRRRRTQEAGTLLLAILLIAIVAVGGTSAYLTTQTTGITNTFTPSLVDCEVEESFDGTTKSEVNVENTGDTEAYIRVKLVTYRVNDDGQHIGGTAKIPDFTPGENWVKYENSDEGYYYYTVPVAPGTKPDTPLIGTSGILLQEYNDADGGKQVIEVMAEAIQSGPAEAVGASWGVTIREGSVTAYTNN